MSLWKLVAVLGVVIAVFVYAGSRAAKKASTAAPAAASLDIGPENVAVATSGPLEVGPSVSGALTALHEARLRAEVSGRVMSTPVLAGQKVRSGDLIVKIDDSAIRDAYLSARSAPSAPRARASTSRDRSLRRAAALRAAR